MKKFLTLLLAMLMVLSLAACNSKTDAEDSRIDEDGNMTDGMETETLMTEENFAKILTEKGLGDMVTTQEINKDGIRKMTPREWARLQGFPDDYKLVLADVHLYKQFGNSVTVPVIQAIAEKIKEVLDKNGRD